SVLTISVAASLLRWGLTRDTVPSADMLTLLDQLQTLVVFCAFIVCLGRLNWPRKSLRCHRWRSRRSRK
ncbi:hypothetical protein L9Z73_30490, partial [Pseudomonas sp. TNT11]